MPCVLNCPLLNYLEFPRAFGLFGRGIFKEGSSVRDYIKESGVELGVTCLHLNLLLYSF